MRQSILVCIPTVNLMARATDMIYSISCVTTILALRIEMALDPSESDVNRAMAHTYIRQGMMCLRQSQTMFPTVKWNIHLFEWVLGQKGLSTATGDMTSPDGIPITVPHGTVNTDSRNDHAEFTRNVQFDQVLPQAEIPLFNGLSADSGVAIYPWFDELLGFDFQDKLDITPADTMKI
jgi:hypothetical protein